MREKFTEIFVINDQLSELTEKTNKLRQRKIELERGHWHKFGAWFERQDHCRYNERYGWRQFRSEHFEVIHPDHKPCEGSVQIPKCLSGSAFSAAGHNEKNWRLI